MKRILLLMLFLHSGLHLEAQTNLDSLYTIWKDETQADSIRDVAFANYIIKGFVPNDPDSVFTLAESMLAFGLNKQLPIAVARAYNLQSISHGIRGNYAQAIKFQNLSLQAYEEIGDKKAIGSGYNNMGNIYYRMGNYTKALECYTKSLNTSEELEDKNKIANGLGNIGTLYYAQGNYEKAIEYHKRALEIHEATGFDQGIANFLSAIGVNYTKLGNHPEAIDYLTRGLELNEKTGSKTKIASALFGIGSSYSDQGYYREAMEYFQKALSISEEVGDKQLFSESQSAIGVNYFKQGKYIDAIKECQKALKISQEIGAIFLQKEACTCLYDSYKVLGQNSEALKYLELMRIAEDSLNAEETSKKLQQMEFAKQVLQDSIASAEKERLVAEAYLEEIEFTERTRNIGIGIGFFVFLLSLLLYSRLRYVRKSKATLQIEKDRSENLLLNILPEEIAQELKNKGKADARDYDMVSILFSDFISFTEGSEKLSAQDLVKELNTCFEEFDAITEKYGIEKIKTIGDAYMAAGGLPVPTDDSVKNTVLAALEMQAFVKKHKAEMDAKGLLAFEMRIGIHTGPVVAGIVGVKKFTYDIWGDTVNTASRIESSGAVGKVNISQHTYNLLKDETDFTFESRGKMEVKGKGEMEMYFVGLKTETV